MHIPSRLVILFFVTVLALAALACGEYPGVPRPLADAGTQSAGLPPAGSFSAAGSGDTNSPQVISGNNIRIELRDFEIVPADLTISAGDVVFTLVNDGRFTHDFRIEGEGLDAKSPRVSAGRTDEWAISLAPGVYHITCPISNHADRGMMGTLTVTP